MSVFEFDCPECGKRFKLDVEGDYSLEPVIWNSGGKRIRVDGEASSFPKPRSRLAFTLLGLAFGISLVWATFASFMAVSRGHQMREAMALREQARQIVVRDKERLHEVYGNIYRYKPGRNPINKRYLDSFEIAANHISVRMINNFMEPVKPNFKILFLNRYGFISDTYSDEWWFSRVKPGETRLSEGTVSFKFGEPIYYAVFFQ